MKHYKMLHVVDDREAYMNNSSRTKYGVADTKNEATLQFFSDGVAAVRGQTCLHNSDHNGIWVLKYLLWLISIFFEKICK